MLCPLPNTIFTISIHRHLPDTPIMAQCTKKVNKLCYTIITENLEMECLM